MYFIIKYVTGDFMNDVRKFIDSLNLKNKCVVVAVSGGPDSMYLLDMLLKLRDNLNIKIVVAHVHHNLRKESDIEAYEVEKYCKKNNVIFEMKKIEEYPNNKFSEESARKIRYLFFDKVVNKYNAYILFTAHHGDDLIETILMRISRGSSLKGYAGFERISNSRGYIIARPLLYLTKKEIIEYLDKNNIWYAEDMSNKNDKYTRNRYRMYILPELKKENINIHKKFIEFNNKLLLANSYIDSQIDKIYEKVVYNNEVDVDKFNKLETILKLYLLERYIKNIYLDDIVLIENKHIDIIIKLLNNNVNKTIDLPGDKKGILEYNKFKVTNKINIESYEYIFNGYLELPNGHKLEKVDEIDNNSNYMTRLYSSSIKLPLHVRTRKNGDVMCVKNMLGSKKINDIFIDCKIPKEQRDTNPIVTDDNNTIVWIPGIKKSHLDRKIDEKYDIIIKYT